MRGVPGWTAWMMWALTVVIWLMIMVLVALPRSVSGAGLLAPLRASGSLLVLSTATVGGLLASRRSSNPIGWIFCVIALVWAVMGFVMEYAVYALVESPGSAPDGELAAWLAAWLWVPCGLGIVLVILLFPEGHFRSNRGKVVAWGAAVGTVVWTFGIGFSPGPLNVWAFSLPRNPFGVEGIPPLLVRGTAGLALLLACAVLAAVSIVARLRQSRGIERQRLKWFAFGAVGANVICGACISFPYLVFGPGVSSPLIQALSAAGLLSLVIMPVSTGIAILRYRLYDIDIIINRTLVYGSVTAVLAGVFAALSIVTQRLVLAITGQESEAAVILAALVVTALFSTTPRASPDRCGPPLLPPQVRRKPDARAFCPPLAGRSRAGSPGQWARRPRSGYGAADARLAMAPAYFGCGGERCGQAIFCLGARN
jgi:hypothetical protein